jgi:transcriptional regulator with XRE-family HTH domain
VLPERALAYVLSTIRAQHGLSQLQVSLAMGASSTSYLSKLENGHRTNPGRRFLRRYVAAFALLGHPLDAYEHAALAGALLAELAA